MSDGFAEMELGTETFAITQRGLTAGQAAERLARDGPNRVPRPRPPSPWRQFAAQMTHFFAVMLWIAALLALVAGVPQLAIAIVVVVVLNGVFAFVQEYRADRAAAKLADLLPASARVLRDGAIQVIDAAELVTDDLVLLEAGDRVSADMRLLTVEAIAVDESMLTGESVAVRFDAGGSVQAGTFVVEGAGQGLVVATGVAPASPRSPRLPTRSAARPAHWPVSCTALSWRWPPSRS